MGSSASFAGDFGIDAGILAGTESTPSSPKTKFDFGSSKGIEGVRMRGFSTPSRSLVCPKRWFGPATIVPRTKPPTVADRMRLRSMFLPSLRVPKSDAFTDCIGDGVPNYPNIKKGIMITVCQTTWPCGSLLAKRSAESRNRSAMFSKPNEMC